MGSIGACLGVKAGRLVRGGTRGCAYGTLGNSWGHGEAKGVPLGGQRRTLSL